MINQPKVYVFSGANASGKSTIIAFLLKEGIIKGKYINADLILKKELKLEETKENYIKAFRIEVERINEAIKNKEDIILEIVASKRIIDKLKKNGYYITYFFIGTENPKVNAVYLTQRVSEGGHDVAIKDLIRRWEQNLKNLNEIKSKVDCLILIDNSSYLQYPILLAVLLKSYFKTKLCYINLEKKIKWLKYLRISKKTIIGNNENCLFCETIKNKMQTQTITMKELNQIFKEKWKMEKPKEIGIDAVVRQWDKIKNSDKLLKEMKKKHKKEENK
jgi:predicted ABC-type ATPase